MRRAGSVLAVALVANGCLERPRSSAAGATSHGPAWDESAAIDVGGRQLVMTGPVLHRALESAPGAPQVVSRRCYFISLGIGFLVELDAWERARHDGAPKLETSWQPSQVGQSSQHCERTFGEGFRLPTSDEAEAWLARNNESGPIFVENAGSLGSARREVQRCEGSQGCPAARVEHGSAQPAMLRCVGPLQARASAVPSEAEVRSCVTAFAGARPDDGESGKLRPLDPGSLDVVLSARQACISGGAAHEQLARTLRHHVGAGTVVAFVRKTLADLRVATEARATLQSVLARLVDEPGPLDCEAAPASYQRACRDPLGRDCLLLQARFARQCQKLDATSQLASAAVELDAEVARIAILAQQASTLARATIAAIRCSERDRAPVAARQALRDVLGAEPPRPAGSRPICPCLLDDLGCGVAALRTRGICPED